MGVEERRGESAASPLLAPRPHELFARRAEFEPLRVRVELLDEAPRVVANPLALRPHKVRDDELLAPFIRRHRLLLRVGHAVANSTTASVSTQTWRTGPATRCSTVALAVALVPHVESGAAVLPVCFAGVEAPLRGGVVPPGL